MPTPTPAELADYRRALALTNGKIDPSHDLPKTPEALRERAVERMERLRTLLRALGDPHLAYRVIHITGTSGKGSTAVAAASLLAANGLRTGLHTSPYLQVATEKIQIDGRLVDGTTFLRGVERVLAAAEAAGIGEVTYGEVWFALVTSIFAEAAVDIAVIEVGAGGRFDLTNLVEPAVSVITSVGLDHMETLGGTIEAIAWHKAGIIKPGVPVISAVTDPTAQSVIAREAAEHKALLTQISAGDRIHLRRGAGSVYDWWEADRPEAVFTSAMAGRFQAINSATALAAVRALDPALVEDLGVIRTGLDHARLQGRFETVASGPVVILDGAHNPEKCAALVRDLRAIRSMRPAARLILVTGMLESKDHVAMLAALHPVADEIVITTPRVLAKPGAPADALAAELRALGYRGPIAVVPEPRTAVETALSHSNKEDAVVVTGSLYLVGNVRGRWFPDDEIVLQRTPWPT